MRDFMILYRGRDCALPLAFRQVESFAIFFCHAELGLEFDTEALTLIVFSHDLIGIPTLLQQDDCRLGQHGSRRCTQGVKRFSGDGKTLGQERAGAAGEGLAKLCESSKTGGLQPGPVPLGAPLSWVL